jgi:hypothetical protein
MQPDKTEGKVLLAIDTNTELSIFWWRRTALRVLVKQDVGDLADSGPTMVADASARYILDREGETSSRSRSISGYRTAACCH